MGRKGRQESNIGKEKLHVCYRKRNWGLGGGKKEKERENTRPRKNQIKGGKAKKMATTKTKNIIFCKDSSTHGDHTEELASAIYFILKSFVS